VLVSDICAQGHIAELENRSLLHSLILDKFIEKPRRLILYSNNLTILLIYHSLSQYGFDNHILSQIDSLSTFQLL